MSARVTVSILCDAVAAGSTTGRLCLAVVSPGPQAATSPTHARLIAREEGWRCDRKGDFCPLHRPDTLVGQLDAMERS